MAIVFLLSSIIATFALAKIAPVLASVTIVLTLTPQIGLTPKISSLPFLLLDRNPVFLLSLKVKAKSSFSVFTGFPRLFASEPLDKSIWAYEESL